MKVKRKHLTIFLVALFFILIFLLFDRMVLPVKNHKNTACAFCDKGVIEYQKYFEDDKVMGLYCYKPIEKGHCLIVPKRHVEQYEDLNKEEILAIDNLIKKTNIAARKVFGVASFLILQKNGKEVGQTIDHIHFHYIPRKEGKKSVLSFLSKFAFSKFKKTVSGDEMEEKKNALSAEIK